MQNKQYVSLFILGLCLGLVTIYFIINGQGAKKSLVVGYMALLLGGLCLLTQPINQREKIFKEGQHDTLMGEVTKIKETDFGQWVTLEKVKRYQNKKWQSIGGQISLQMKSEEVLSPFDTLTVKTKKLENAQQMNPSDFDNPLYEKAIEQWGRFKVERVVAVSRKQGLFEKWQMQLERQITKLYKEPARGVMRSVIMGQSDSLDAETKKLYNACGIGHVLSISGFHVGLMMGLFLLVFYRIDFPYGLRQLILLLGVWGYTFLTGSHMATIRASVMTTVLLIGQMLWREADGWTDLSIAAALILVARPYQFFMVGFQLSFGAVATILIYQQSLQSKTLMGEYVYPKWRQTLSMWLGIQLMTWPILAYHFYEIPFLAGILNLVVIPLFSLVIVGGLLSILLDSLGLMVAFYLAEGLSFVINSMNQVCRWVLTLPFATLCVGRPSFVQLLLYGVIIALLIGAMLYGWRKWHYLMIGLTVFANVLLTQVPRGLAIYCLYVGQGDGAVIATPHGEMIVVDGGNKGQGKTIMDAIKYQGKRGVHTAFLSHSDADHISGIIELLQSDFKVGQVIISKWDQGDNLDKLLKCCQQKRVPCYRMDVGDEVVIDQVKFKCYAPLDHQPDQANDYSLVCKMSYGRFSLLWTGDKGVYSNPEIYNKIGPVTVLKVSHHGSYTGTNREMLLKLRPSYAMISCGKHNLYGHPHKQVVADMQAVNVQLSRTDTMGRITYKTDGAKIETDVFRKEVQ